VLRISAAGFRFAHARKTPQLADSASSLYTTSFPTHSTAARAFSPRQAGKDFGARLLGQDYKRGVHG